MEARSRLTYASHVLVKLPVRDASGQSLAEYALILGLIAIVAIVSLIFLGDTLADLMSYIGDTVDQST